MPFTLKLTFTGLCTFVPNSNIYSQAKMCVLLVDATGPSTTQDVLALDQTELRMHRGFMKFPIRASSPAAGLEENFGIWYLDRQRLCLDIVEEEEHVGSNQFSIVELNLLQGAAHPQLPNIQDPVESRSLSWVADMNLVSNGLAEIDKRTLQPFPQGVTAQFVIDKGEVATETFTRVVWDYEQTLSGVPYVRNLAHRAVLTLKNLKSARIVSVSFEPNAKPTFIELTPAMADSVVRVEIANSCQDNPLQWLPFPDPVPDQDTKWFFELLNDESKEAIKQSLKGQTLPIPRPTGSRGVGGPGSSNCIPNRASAVSFDLPNGI